MLFFKKNNYHIQWKLVHKYFVENAPFHSFVTIKYYIFYFNDIFIIFSITVYQTLPYLNFHKIEDVSLSLNSFHSLYYHSFL